MKRVIILTFALIICLFSVACDPGSYSFTKEEYLADVVGIDLVIYSNDKQKSFASWVPDQEDKLVPIDPDNLSIVETLDEESYPAFIEQLSKVRFLYKYYAYDSPRDICIRLIHENDDFTLINVDRSGGFSGYVGRYDSSGKVLFFVGCFENGSDFINLINDNFEAQIAVGDK